MGALCHRTQLRRVNFGLSSRSTNYPQKFEFFYGDYHCGLFGQDIFVVIGTWQTPACAPCVGTSIHGCMLSLSVLGLDVWALADPIIIEHIGHTTEPSGRQWLFSMKHEEFTRMVVTVWVIWHARRKVIHEDIYQSPRATHQFVGSFVHDLGVAH
jgi:hypothetical protein